MPKCNVVSVKRFFSLASLRILTKISAHIAVWPYCRQVHPAPAQHRQSKKRLDKIRSVTGQETSDRGLCKYVRTFKKARITYCQDARSEERWRVWTGTTKKWKRKKKGTNLSEVNLASKNDGRSHLRTTWLCSRRPLVGLEGWWCEGHDMRVCQSKKKCGHQAYTQPTC